MQAINLKLNKLNLFFVLGLASAGPSGRAADLSEVWATNPPPRLIAEVRTEGGPGQMTVKRGYITAGTAKFGFEMPSGFRLDTSDPQKVALVSADNSCVLAVRFLGPVAEVKDLDPAFCRGLMLRHLTDATVLEEFSLAALSRRGPAFDVACPGPKGTSRRGRVVYAVADPGVLEFSLFSSPTSFEPGRQALNLLLVSFRASDARGRLEMPVVSDKF